MLVLLAGPHAVPGMSRPGGHRDVLGHLEAEEKIGRGHVEELRPIVLGRELVEGEVAADGRERPRILGQAFRLEFLLRELAARLVTLRIVDRTEPALVLPRAGAEVNAYVSQGSQLGSQPGGLERQVGGVEQRLLRHDGRLPGPRSG